jgi:CHASE2 domain-containing sensor protein
MRGRVVLIGENYNGVDQHETVVGTLPGVQLWANYVEAILDDNLFRQVPIWMTYTFGFIVFVSIELASWKLSAFKKVLAIAGLVVGSFVVCYLVVRLTGYYLSPAVGILGAVLSHVGQAATSVLGPQRR